MNHWNSCKTLYKQWYNIQRGVGLNFQKGDEKVSTTATYKKCESWHFHCSVFWNPFFWDMTACHWVTGSWHFKGMQCLHNIRNGWCSRYSTKNKSWCILTEKLWCTKPLRDKSKELLLLHIDCNKLQNKLYYSTKFLLVLTHWYGPIKKQQVLTCSDPI